MPRTDEAEATIRILGEDLVSGVAAKAEKNVDKIGDAADKAKGPLGKLKDKFDDLGKSTVFTEINQGFELVGKAGQAFAAIWDGLKEAAAERSVANSFQAAFGGGADALERLEQASQGLLADGALRELGTQGARAGLSLEQVARLLETSTRAAMATGTDVAEQATTFLKTVIEGNDEATKQNGVLVNLAGAQAAYATSIGKTAAELTGAEKAQASLGEVTRQTDLAFQNATGDEAVNRVSRLEARWANFSASMREFALSATIGLPEVASGAVDAVASTFDQATKNMLDKVTQGDYTEAKIASIINGLKRRGHAVEAFTLGVQLQTRATELLAQEEAALDRVYAEHAAQVAAVEKAETARVKVFSDEITKTEEAKHANVEHARQLALMADAMGVSSQSGERWQAVLSALGAAHVSAADDVLTLYGAIKSSNSEMAKAIELQAEMAAAAGDTVGADALRAQALGIVTGETGSKGSGGKGKGGGSKKPTIEADNAKATADGQRRLIEEMQAIAEEAERISQDQHARAMENDQANHQARIDALVQQHDEQEALLLESRQAGFDSLSDSVLGLRDALGEIDGISLDGLANAAKNMGPLIDQFTAMGAATDKSKNAMISGSLGIVAASGRMVAGIIKDQKAQAIIMCLVEQAEAWSAFAQYDYLSFGAHLAASALWGVVAGTSGGKAGGGGGGGSGSSAGRGGRDVARVPNEAPPDSPQFSPVTIHISGGTYLGTDAERTGRELAKMVDRHRGRSFRSGDAGSPP